MFLALMVVASANKIEGGLPGNIRMHMLFNVVLDFVIGLVPFVGDLADAMYKCNTRNAVLLEGYLKKKGQENLKQTSHQLTAVGNSHGSRNGARRPATSNTEPTRPEPARLHTGRSGRSGRTRERDLEMGL